MSHIGMLVEQRIHSQGTKSILASSENAAPRTIFKVWTAMYIEVSCKQDLCQKEPGQTMALPMVRLLAVVRLGPCQQHASLTSILPS